MRMSRAERLSLGVRELTLRFENDAATLLSGRRVMEYNVIDYSFLVFKTKSRRSALNKP